MKTLAEQIKRIKHDIAYLWIMLIIDVFQLILIGVIAYYLFTHHITITIK